MCTWVHYPQRTEEGITCNRTGVRGDCEPPHMSIGNQTWDPLEEQQGVLTVKSSLQLLLWYFLGEDIIMIFVLRTILQKL